MSPLTKSAFSVAVALVGTLVVVPVASAQGPTEPPPDFDEVLFPPELIMQHRREIGLTDGQREEITTLIEDLQGRMVRLQWELLDEMQQLTRTLQQPRVDLDQAMDQLGSTLNREKEIKEAHLELLIRMKNVLSAEQQTELRRLRGSGSGPPDEA